MKRLALLILLAALPAFAQSNAISLSLLQPQFSSGSVSLDGDRVGVKMQSRTGFGAGFTHRFANDWSVTIDARQLRAPGTAQFSPSARVGTFDLKPLAALVHYNVGNVFIGAGIADVMTGDLRSSDLEAMGIGKVSLSDDVTYVIDGGFALPIRGPVGVAIEARYMPVNVKARAQSQSATLKFNALTLGAALRWKF